MKRAVSILAAALILGVIFAGAASVGEDGGALRVTVGTVRAGAGDTVDVDIRLEGVSQNAPAGIVSVLAGVSWDGRLTLTQAVYNCDLSEDGAKKSGTLIHTPKKLKEATEGGVKKHVADWNGTESPYRFNWLAADDADAIKSDCVFVTLMFRVAESAQGKIPVTVQIDPEDLFDANGKNVRFEISQGYIEVSDVLEGDSNGDGEVNGKDLVRLRKYLDYFNDETGTSQYPVSAGADCNGDGLINGKDLIRLRKYLDSYDPDAAAAGLVRRAF